MRVVSLICLGAVAASCHPPAAPGPQPLPAPSSPPGVTAPPPPAGRATVEIAANEPDGVLLARILDTKAAKTEASVATLSAAETQTLLARLEPLPALDTTKAPAVRPASLPPPRSGTVQPIAFAVPQGRPAADGPSRPVAIVKTLVPPQISPSGELAGESQIRIRFDEPMVAVAQVGEIAAPPATIAPPVPGIWRWLDTRVLQFTAAGERLPQATEFVVKVPAGVRAVSGATLIAPAEGTFATSPVRIVGAYPRITRADSAIALVLDQDVDPAKLALHVWTLKHQPQPFRFVDRSEAERTWAANPSLKADPPQLGKHALFVMPVGPASAWRPNDGVELELAAGTGSREGPRVTPRAQAVRVQIVDTFRALGIACDGRPARTTGAQCSARGTLNVELSNPIAPATFHSPMIQIDGTPLQDHAPRSNGVWLIVPGTVGRAYGVTLSDGLADIYGQPLTGERRLPFTVTAERFASYLDAPSGMHVLDPRFEIPQWIVQAEAVPEVRIQLLRVEPNDYFAYQAFEAGKRATPPGKPIADQRYPVGAKGGINLRVDLRPALDRSGAGHVVAIATAAGVRRSVAWLQVTRLGLVARIDGEKANAWVRDIKPASFLGPIPGAAMSLVVDGKPAGTAANGDADGHAVLELPPHVDRKSLAPPAILVARAQADSTFVAIDTYNTYEKALRGNLALWYVTDDRFTYRPGEKVYVKGWVRWTHDGVDPDLALPTAGEPVTYTLADARGNQLTTGSAALSDQGGFDFAIDLPPAMNLGTATLQLKTRDQTFDHPLRVEEFRTPAYSVSITDDVRHGGALPVIAGEELEMQATATYYAGGGLGGAAIAWDAKLSPTSYAPAGWSAFSFSPPPIASPTHPSWRYDDDPPPIELHRSATLGGDSASAIAFGFPALCANRTSVLEVDAVVTDLDRSTIRASSHPIIVHPSAYYVGLRGPRDGVLEAIVTDLDGNPVRGVAIAIELTAVLGSERYRDSANVVDTQHCALTSDAAPVTCAWQRRDPRFAYTAVARIADQRGRANAAHFEVPWWSPIEADFDIVADRHDYRPGDVAKLAIKSQVFPAVAIVTFARQGVIRQQRVALASASTVVELPISPSYIENVDVIVDRFAKRREQLDGSTLPLPEYAEARTTIEVDTSSARLEMQARSTAAIVQPGDQATFEVVVRRAGKPVANAEVALIVVDEAILALSAHTHADPLAPFYHHTEDGTWQVQSLDLALDEGDVLAGEPGATRYKLGEGVGQRSHGTGSGYGIGGGQGGMRGANLLTGTVTARKDLRPTAVFAPRLHTDADGKVSVQAKMPDSLTRFRIVALATAENRYFGKAEGTITTQRKLNARAVAPRFLSQGDAFGLPVVVQNLDAAPRTIDVAVRAANLAGTPPGKRVTLGGGQRAELRFDFATRQRGRAILQVIAVSGEFADASETALRVDEPATTEAFAAYGVVEDAPRFEQLAVSGAIFPDVGGVDVELASTQLQALIDAYWYLYAYPYECAEQRSSRMLATSGLLDILDAFTAPGRPTRAEVLATRAKDLEILEADQLADGGWGYFRGMPADPFVTMQVLSALAGHNAKWVGKAAALVTKQAAASLALVEAHRGDDLAYQVSLTAIALTALASAGLDVHARVVRLHTAALATAYPIDAKARVLALLAKRPADRAIRAKLVADLVSAAHETAASASITTTYAEAERLLLVSSTKTTALALDALIREVPEHPLIPKLARGVLDARKRGRWGSTQDNLAVIGAMRRYFDTYEKATPNYTGKLWFGKDAYLEQAFVGRSAPRATAHLDWTALAPGSSHDVALAKDGTGRMYYRLGITYAPKQTDLPALDAGFLVRRTYTAVDNPADVTRLPDGRLKIRLGARVLVQVEALATAKRDAVAIVDPLPAGLEAVNDRLATSERAVTTTPDTRWDYRNMRDNRSEVFAMHLGEGTHTFTYTARAATPGTFFAAPAKAEEMYSPETFGRSTGQVVVIE